MSTAVLALPNTYATGQSLPHADFNTLVDTVEWLGAGYLSLSVAGSSNVTLTAAQYQVSILKLTGVLTGSISVLVPDAAPGRRWVVYNATTGAFTVTVKPVSGTGIVVTQGKTAFLFTDGTNVLDSVSDLAAVGSAASGANADITSMTGLTGALAKPTGINDTNGNEVVKFAAGVASAVNEVTFTNAATGNGPLVEATGGDTNIDVTLRGKGAGGTQLSRSGGKLAFFGAALVARAAALTQTYATADRTLSAYTPDAESGAYTGIDNLQVGTVYATVADLNALRVATENLRLFTEDLAQFVNALVDDMQAYGLES